MRSKHLPYIILSILVAVIAYANIQPGTIFSGWDNLHPEFNIPLNLQRSIFSVWQGHEGLGHTGGHGYAATLPHTFIIWFLSLFLPMSYLRYAFTFLALLTGSIGAYKLIIYLLKDKLKDKKEYVQYTLALVGSVFYMLNFGTVQQFTLQLEAFIIHFVALPWSVYFILSLLDRWNGKKYFFFLILLFFTSTQGFIPPLFIAYMLIICALLLASIFFYRTRDRVTTAVVLFLSIMLINAYWLLPVIHYSLTQSREFLNAYNNILSTDSWTLTNNKYGTVQDLAILRGFPMQARTETPGLPQAYVFQPWINHFTNIWIQAIGYSFFGIIIIGFIYFAYRNKKNYIIAILIVSLLFFSILSARIPLISTVSSFLQKFPLIKQAFRTGFTKLSISLSLFYSVYFAFGLLVLMEILHRFLKHRYLAATRVTRTLLVLSAFVGIIAFSYPTFSGYFLYSGSRISIPNAYQKVFDFFQNQNPSARIATLPQGEQWGWSHYRWGYVGSGFLWFGLPQPVMERAFDVWSSNNENYYWELSYALYSGNRTLLDNVLDKYSIGWILYDESFIPYTNIKNAFYSKKIKDMVDGLANVELVRSIPLFNFQNNYLHIYKRRQYANSNSIELKYIPFDSSRYYWNNDDRAYKLFGSYWSYPNSSTNDPRFYFPFRSLFTGRNATDREFTLDSNKNSFVFSAQIPNIPYAGILTAPSTTKETFAQYSPDDPNIPMYPKIVLSLNEQPLFSVNREANGNLIEKTLNVTSGSLDVIVPIIWGYYSYDSNNPGIIFPEIRNCDDSNINQGNVSIQEESGIKTYVLNDFDSSTCVDLYIPTLSHKFSYLITVESKNILGSPLTLEVINGTSKRTDLTVQLPSNIKSQSTTTTNIILPPMEQDGMGYSIRLANTSISKRSINKFGRITVNSIPYDFLKNIFITSGLEKISQQYSQESITFSHPNPAYYGVRLRSALPNSMLDARCSTLVLSQSFDHGWRAYDVSQQCTVRSGKCRIAQLLPFLFGTELKNHVLINNWSNGWTLPRNEQTNNELTIVIFFLPQLLEWFGFLLLPLPFLYVLWPRRNRQMYVHSL